MIATCPKCSNTGAVGERYCWCESAMALRARIDNDPTMQRKRAEIQRLLDDHSSMTVLVPKGQS